MKDLPARATVPSSWELLPLKELGDWCGGGTPSKSKLRYWEGGTIPWVSPKDMKTERINDSEDHITKEAVTESTANFIAIGSVLLVTRSGILRHTLPVAVNTVRVTVNQDLKALTPRTGISPEYVAWALRAFSRDILHTCSKQGTTVNSVETTKLLRYEIPIAPPEQQTTIVAEIEKQFSRLDEAVTNLKRVKANLKRYKAAVEGKLTKEWRKQHPNLESASKLLERILAERRAKWNGRGKYKEPVKPAMTEPLFLPEKWIWTTVEQLTAIVTSGSRGWGEYYSNTGPLFIRAQDIKTDSLNLPNVARVMIPHNAEGTRTAVSKGDVLITITGANVTKSALVRELKEEAFVSQHVALLKPSLTAISTYLFTWVVAPTHGRKTLERWAYGAGKPGLSLEQVRSLPVALPPLAEQIQMADEVERRLSVIDELEAAVEANLIRADRLRQSILQRAFSGRLLSEKGHAGSSDSHLPLLAAESVSPCGVRS